MMSASGIRVPFIKIFISRHTIMKSIASQRKKQSVALSRSYQLKKLMHRALWVGISVSTLLTGGSAFAESTGFEGAWSGTFTVRPPGQDEIKNYKIMIKLSQLINDPSYSNPLHQIQEAKIAHEKQANFINLDVKHIPYKGQVIVSRYHDGFNYRVRVGTIYLISRIKSREDGGKLSKAFPDCMNGLEFKDFRFDPSGNFIEGKVGCNISNPKWYSPNWGTVTLQRNSTVRTSVTSSPETTNNFPAGQNSQIIPINRDNDVSPQQGTQNRQPSPEGSILNEVENRVPGLFRNIFR
jgi:hypothetical protein